MVVMVLIQRYSSESFIAIIILVNYSVQITLAIGFIKGGSSDRPKAG